MGKRYAIIDIETTGVRAKRDKITEIAVVLVENGQVISKWSSLINPERSVPKEITRITGITTEMVSESPKFYEAARDFLDFVKGSVFVAHNAHFDYGFIQEEFRQLGFSFSMKRLCTLRMSKRLLPGMGSYSLANLTKKLNITVLRSHRALDDALATSELLLLLLSNESNEFLAESQILKKAIAETKLPTNITSDDLLSLPEGCGLYYMYDVGGHVLYVGKSTNIRKRVFQHFSANTKKAERMREEVYSLSCRITESELMALVKESYEIKKLQPPINKAQRIRSYPYIISSAVSKDGFPFFVSIKVTLQERKKTNVIGQFSSQHSAQASISMALSECNLCVCINEDHPRAQNCMFAQIDKCGGAGVGRDDIDYPVRFSEAIDFISTVFHEDMIILEKCISKGWATFFIEDGVLRSIGYIDDEKHIRSFDEMLTELTNVEGNPEVNRLISTYLSKNKTKIRIVKRENS